VADSTASSGGQFMTSGDIAGIVIGCAVLAVVIAIVIVVVVKKRTIGLHEIA